MHTRSHDPTPFFQVVFVRRERTAEGRATEGVEKVEERATEGFEMIEGREEPTLYRQV